MAVTRFIGQQRQHRHLPAVSRGAEQQRLAYEHFELARSIDPGFAEALWDRLFDAGHLHGIQPLGDEALLLTGLIYAYPDNPDKDYRKSVERFRRLQQEYPESQRNQLATWLALLVSETAEKDGRIAELTEKLGDLEKAVAEGQAKQKKLKQVQLILNLDQKQFLNSCIMFVVFLKVLKRT